MKNRYFVVVEPEGAGILTKVWHWIVWSRKEPVHGLQVAEGFAPSKAIALKIGRAVRDAYKKDHP